MKNWLQFREMGFTDFEKKVAELSKKANIIHKNRKSEANFIVIHHTAKRW